MILEQYLIEMKIPLSDGWTLDAQATGGPNRADEWGVVMVHRDGVHQVVQVRPGPEGDPPVERVWYSGPSNPTATEHFLLATGSMVREAQGLPPVTTWTDPGPSAEELLGRPPLDGRPLR